MDALARRRVKTLGLLGLVCAVMLTALAPPAHAAKNGRKMKIAVPASGTVSVLTFDVRARRAGRVPGRVLVGLKVPRRLRTRLGLVINVDRERGVKRFTVFVVHRRRASGTAAQRPGTVTVRVRGLDRQVAVRNIERARNALDRLSDEMADLICTSNIEAVKVFFGLRGLGANAIAEAIKAVLCDTADEDDIQFLEDIGLIVPEDSDEFECGPFPGNPFEATCIFEDTAIDAVRIQGTGGLIFSQCFAGPHMCTIHQPGQPNNFVLFDIPDGSSSTGPLNLRSSNEMFDGWGYVRLYQSSDGGQTFRLVEGFIP